MMVFINFIFQIMDGIKYLLTNKFFETKLQNIFKIKIKEDLIMKKMIGLILIC